MLTRILVVAVAGGALALAVVGWRFSIFILPVGWSGELDTLAGALRIAPGQVVADIGAGDGALELVEVQPEGRPVQPAKAWRNGARLTSTDRFG